jgi:type II secretory pathway pseudopilin PulG
MEMVVILAIIALILGMAAPFFTRFSSSTKLKAAIRDISASLSSARNYAITYRSDATVSFDLDKEAYILECPKATIKKDMEVPKGIDIEDTDFPSHKVTFKPTGGLKTKGGSITIKDRTGKVKKITISQTTGRIRIE